MKKIALAMALMAVMGIAEARGYNQGGFYIGAGISDNDLDGFGDNATGFQFFGGYDLDMVRLGALKSAVEVGYMDSGDFEECVNVPFVGNVCGKDSAQGLWANYVVGYDFTPVVSGIGRVGFDFGDDDGFMFGAGLGFNVAPQFEIRGEYVVRDHIDSLQANFVYHM